MRMNNSTGIARSSAAVSRVGVANQQAKTLPTPPLTISTDALRVGLAHLVHEINNPLQFVYNAVSLMEMQMPATNGCRDPLTVEALERGKSAIKNLISLINALRSQLEILWQINPASEVLNLSTLIDEIIQNEAMRFEANGISFAKVTVDTFPLIQGNKNLLRVAILNLFKNASDAMPEGGELRIRIGTEERSVYLEISDSGSGIPPDLDVFQPFATSKPGGTGLGLAIVRHIVVNYQIDGININTPA